MINTKVQKYLFTSLSTSLVTSLFATSLAIGMNTMVYADTTAPSENENKTETTEEVKHQLVIQVSTDDLRTQKIAMNNAVNLQELYGIDNVTIEIVAYGPGLGMLTKKSKYSSRVQRLVLQQVWFDGFSEPESG